MEEFSKLLIQLRKDKKKSIRKLAEEADISHTYLSTLERGFDPRSKKVRKPAPEILKKLAGPLGVEYSTLLHAAGYEDLYKAEKYKEAIEQFSNADIDPINLEILNEVRGPVSPETLRKLNLALENIEWWDKNTPLAKINEADTEYKARGFFDLKEVLEKYPSLSYGEKILSLPEREKVKAMLEVLFKKE